MNEITYKQNGDYLIPELSLPEQTESIGKYGRMRKNHLKEHRPVLFNSLLLSGKLYPHLLEIEQTAQNRLTQLMQQLTAAQGVNESLKAKDPMQWTGRMNNCTHTWASSIPCRIVDFLLCKRKSEGRKGYALRCCFDIGSLFFLGWEQAQLDWFV